MDSFGDPRSDFELLRDCDADPGAFGIFYNRHASVVLRFLYRRTACAHTAADLTAETFAQALLGRRRLREDAASARPWLFGIAKRELSRFLRKRRAAQRAVRRLGIVIPVLEDESIERIEAIADAAKFVEPLREALATMPSGMADAVMLRVAQGLPFQEVASRLGCSPGAARVRVCRGLIRLHDALEAPA